MTTGLLEISFGIGTVALALGVVWAIIRNKQRNRANDPITEAATREEYEKPGTYDPEKFRARLHPKR